MTKSETENVTKDVAKRYEPTPDERAALAALAARTARRPPCPAATIKKNGNEVRIGFDHPDPPTGHILFMEAIGTSELGFSQALLLQLANASGTGPTPDEGALNFNLAVVKGIEPRDQIEAMIAAQMAAVHSAAMIFARRLAHVDTIPQQDSAERAFNKLARTFAVQVEALKRYRTGGEQRVTVQHVTVNEGGQAIVGAVATSGQGGGKGGGGRESLAPTP
jgi:hypothetical protein